MTVCLFLRFTHLQYGPDSTCCNLQTLIVFFFLRILFVLQVGDYIKSDPLINSVLLVRRTSVRSVCDVPETARYSPRAVQISEGKELTILGAGRT